MVRRAIAILFLPLLMLGCRKQQATPTTAPVVIPPLPAAIVARSRFSNGDFARLDRVLLKAKSGQPITLGFIGGSITWGQMASQPELAYAPRITDWWRQHFPNTPISYVNAGIKGTGSSYGCVRVQKDLLSHHPDFVVVEFGVNDKGDLPHAETYEGVIRQILADPNQPAIVEVFTMHHDGTNAQEFQGEIGRRYQLPMISFRDAFWPEILNKQMKYSDVISDAIHPNDTGHAAIAQFVESLLADALAKLPAAPPAISPMPPPRYTALFQHIQLIRGDKLTPTLNTGWTYNPADHSWQADKVGSTIEFTCQGPLIELAYARTSPLGGVAYASVDDRSQTRCDAWFDGTWDGYPQFDELTRNLPPGPHRVRVVLSNEQNMYNKFGHRFEILGLVRAGIAN